jgi:hypothetical protein
MRELFSVLRTGFGMLRMEEVGRRANNTIFVEVEPTSYELVRDFRVSTRQVFVCTLLQTDERLSLAEIHGYQTVGKPPEPQSHRLWTYESSIRTGDTTH